MSLKKSLLGFAFASYLVSAISAQAAPVTSMTIVEIGYSGVGSSAAGTGAGIFYFGFEVGNGMAVPYEKNFTSTGTADGMIIMGVAQGNGAFATPFTYGGSDPALFNFSPNTLGGLTTLPTGPTGDISGNTFTLDLTGWGAYFNLFVTQYQLFPDPGTLVTAVQQIDATHYYYTADWSHIITAADEPFDNLLGQRADWHIEGIATTAVPIPAAGWLLVSGLVGLMGFTRRRKLRAIDSAT